MPFKSFFCLFAVLLALMSCDDNAINDTSSVSGRFVTEDGKAIEGALVRVFTVKPMDTLVMRLRRDYKDVGCDISDATEFDHRFYGKPLTEGHTDSDGKFSFDNLSGGPYHISVTHPEYSWRYVYRKNGDLGQITTKPVIKIKGVLSGEVVWDVMGQDYVITDNTTQNGGSLLIKSGVIIRLRKQCKLLVQDGQVIFQGQVNLPVRITSDTDSAIMNFQSSVNANRCNVDINNIVCSAASSGLSLTLCKGIIQNSYFNNNIIGCILNQNKDALKVTNLIGRFNERCTILNEGSQSELQNIISHNSQYGINCTNGSSVPISNSYCDGALSGIILQGKSTANIMRCEINGIAGITIIGARGTIVNSNVTGQPAITVKDHPTGGDNFHFVNATQTNFFFQNLLFSLFVKKECDFDNCYFNGFTEGDLKQYIETGSDIGQLGNKSAKFENINRAPITEAGLIKK